MERGKIAHLYRAKSDESFQAARICFERKLFRATCNRSWYSTMQIITAGVYQELDLVPQSKDLNFSHMSQSRIYKELCRSARMRSYEDLATLIAQALERRNEADYGVDTALTEDMAKRSLSTADQIRKVVYKIVGPAWQ